MNKPLSYLERNALGYEGDTFIHGELEKLVKKFDIKAIIETGTFLGATTKRLATLVNNVYTIENVPENHLKAVENTKDIDNIIHLNASSQDVLYDLIDSYISRELNDKLLFFLDAHWYDYCPLLDELRIIEEHALLPVIVIHDFKVPGKPEFGFDSYKEQDFEFDWIKKHIEAIYGKNGYEYHYNEQADGAMRGVIYIYPKK